MTLLSCLIAAKAPKMELRTATQLLMYGTRWNLTSLRFAPFDPANPVILPLVRLTRFHTAPDSVQMMTEPCSPTPTEVTPSLRESQIHCGCVRAFLILTGLVVEAADWLESPLSLRCSVKRSPRAVTAAIVSPPAVIKSISLRPPD